jgi:hypothetical protein
MLELLEPNHFSRTKPEDLDGKSKNSGYNKHVLYNKQKLIEK